MFFFLKQYEEDDVLLLERQMNAKKERITFSLTSILH